MNNNNVKTEEFSFVKKDRYNEIFIIERPLSIEFSRQIFLGL